MFEVKIRTGNASFRDYELEDGEGNYELDPTGWQVRCLLDEIKYKLSEGLSHGSLYDVNGNKVGEWRYD